mmetsp:Transcript_31431/g.50749  ORF Transcript_31431/g.50749 Transcript_31431/m.50749 type:complete len:92 (-) Transcript_31431:104-379(-)
MHDPSMNGHMKIGTIYKYDTALDLPNQKPAYNVTCVSSFDRYLAKQNPKTRLELKQTACDLGLFAFGVEDIQKYLNIKFGRVGIGKVSVKR